MKLSRLSGRKICERVMNKGRVWRGKTMVIRWLPGAPPYASAYAKATADKKASGGKPRYPDADPRKSAVYAGTFASQRLHKSAVKRNRMRRRCREALRLELRERDDIPTIQLLLSPRSRSLSCGFADIQNDVRSFLSNVQVCLQKVN